MTNLLVQLRAEEVLQASEAAKVLSNYELYFHKGSVVNTHLCLKKQLGTGKNASTFYKLLSARKSKGLLLKFVLKLKLVRRLHEAGVFLFVKFCFSVLVHLILYTWDLVKDIYFLVVYSQFFPVERNDFDSFGFQMFFILLLSILVPNLLNGIVLLADNQTGLSGKERSLLLAFVFVSQSVISYSTTKIGYLKDKLAKGWQSSSPAVDGSTRLCQPLTQLEQRANRLARLQAKLRTIEAVFESSVQALVLLITIAIHFR